MSQKKKSIFKNPNAKAQNLGCQTCMGFEREIIPKDVYRLVVERQKHERPIKKKKKKTGCYRTIHSWGMNMPPVTSSIRPVGIDLHHHINVIAKEPKNPPWVSIFRDWVTKRSHPLYLDTWMQVWHCDSQYNRGKRPSRKTCCYVNPVGRHRNRKAEIRVCFTVLLMFPEPTREAREALRELIKGPSAGSS